MDDAATFGPVAYSYGFGQAVQAGLLADYRVVVIGVTAQELRPLLDRVPADAALRTLVAQVAILKAMRKYKIDRVVSFHASVKRATDFVNPLSSESLQARSQLVPTAERPLHVHTGWIVGTVPAETRARILRRLQEESPFLLANCQCLSEGVDAPAIDGILFVDPKKSLVQIVQATGRALRLHGDKVSHVVLPLYLGETDFVDVSKTNFDVIWTVLHALRSHDGTLAAELDRLRTHLGDPEATDAAEAMDRYRKRVIVDLPLPAKTAAAVAQDLYVRMIRAASSDFYERLGILRAFVRANGWAKVHQKLEVNGRPLGTWIRYWRDRRGELARYQREALESIEGWRWQDRPRQTPTDATDVGDWIIGKCLGRIRSNVRWELTCRLCGETVQRPRLHAHRYPNHYPCAAKIVGSHTPLYEVLELVGRNPLRVRVRCKTCRYVHTCQWEHAQKSVVCKGHWTGSYDPVDLSDDELRQLYEQGSRLRSLSMKTRQSHRDLIARIQRAGGTVRPEDLFPPLADLEEMRKTMTIPEIAEKIGKSRTSLYRFLQSASQPMPLDPVPPKRRPKRRRK